jgi:hypothetical protein
VWVSLQFCGRSDRCLTHCSVCSGHDVSTGFTGNCTITRSRSYLRRLSHSPMRPVNPRGEHCEAGDALRNVIAKTSYCRVGRGGGHCMCQAGVPRPGYFTNLSFSFLFSLRTSSAYHIFMIGECFSLHQSSTFAGSNLKPCNNDSVQYCSTLVRWGEVILRLTIGQSVFLGIEHPLELATRYSCRYVAVWNLRSCFCGAPSLTRGPVYN